MNFNKIIQSLVPRHDNFFKLFEEDIQNLMVGGKTLEEAFHFPLTEESKKKLRKIEDIEHEGDMITHRIFRELSASFVVPFDREDIHMLTSSIDDVLDNIQGISKRIFLYEINSFPDAGLQIVHTLNQSCPTISQIDSIGYQSMGVRFDFRCP